MQKADVSRLNLDTVSEFSEWEKRRSVLPERLAAETKIMTNADDAAMGHGAENGHCCGLTKREYFAAMAMQGILAHPNTPGNIRFAEVSERAVPMADALIDTLNETK